MKDFLDKHPKLKNPYFYLSVIALIFSASGVDFNQLTNWNLLGNALLGIVNNPVAIVAVITAFIGIWNDNSLPGLDKINRKMTVEPKDPQERVKNIPGVCYIKSNGKYKAYIKINNKQKHLGYFDNLEDAIKARKEAEESMKGDE